MDIALNSLQSLICHKTQKHPKNQSKPQVLRLKESHLEELKDAIGQKAAEIMLNMILGLKKMVSSKYDCN